MSDMGQIARTDAELVEASRRGEREAFGQLVSRYQDVVCAVSYSGTGNWALSEDVAQDTFIAAWRQLGQLREIGRLRAWLCGIARNLARKARQRTARDVDIDDGVERGLPALDASPFDRTAQAEVDRVVREALARIPEAYRETLVLYYCENRSVRDVAQTLGIAEDAAMQRLSRGRRSLNNALHPADGVTELVERSLRGGARPRKDLRVAVVAALPHVGPVTPRGSNMWKISVVSAALVITGATASVIALTRGDDTPSPAAKAPTSVAMSTGTPAPHASHPPAIAMATPPTPPPHAPPSLPADDDAPVRIEKATRDRLGLERGPSRGPANAPITIVVFQDLQCHFCGKVLGTLDELWDEFPGKLRLVVKQFPVHETAKLAAEASLAAEAQGKFWELHDAMMAHQDDLSRDAIVAYATQAGLDAAALGNALDQHTYAPALAQEVSAASEIGVEGTPVFLVNGRQMVGAQPIEQFRATINEALAALPATNP